jgi:hypothetical protein
MQLVVLMSSPRDIEKLNRMYEDHKRVSASLWFLYAAAGLGLAGMLLALFQKGISAAILLVVAAVGPMVLLPLEKLLVVLLFLGALPLAGIFAFFVRPKPPPSLANAEA